MGENSSNRGLASFVRENFFLDTAAFFLLLCLPYLNFVTHYKFVLESANFFIAAVFAAVAAILAFLLKILPSHTLRFLIIMVLIALFADIQFLGGFLVALVTFVAAIFLLCLKMAYRSQIVAVICGVMALVTIAQPLFAWAVSGKKSTTMPSAMKSAGKPRLPIIVHVILDGHLAIEGFSDNVPTQSAIKKELKKFFLGNGFRLFTRTYGLYDSTVVSLSTALNFHTDGNFDGLISGSSSYRLNQNRYLSGLEALGYRVNVYQSNYVDFCSALKDKTGVCRTYHYSDVSSANLKKLSVVEKTKVVLAVYTDLLVVKRIVHSVYDWVRLRFGRLGLPHWPWTEPGNIGPIAVVPVFDRLIADVAAAPPGNMFFAHFLLPHTPYSVDATCNARRPVVSWPNNDITGNRLVVDQRVRLKLYNDYILQVRCSLSRLQALLDVMKKRDDFKDAVIVIHGDHGSRIRLVAPGMANLSRMSPRDYSDSYSTLFAMRSQHLLPDLDPRILSLNDVIYETLGPGRSGLGPSAEGTKFIFLPKPSVASDHPLCIFLPLNEGLKSSRNVPRPLRDWAGLSCNHGRPKFSNYAKSPMPEIWSVNTGKR